jgi:hypothetical protein
MNSSDDVDERVLVKGLLGLFVGLIAVGVLAGLAYFGSATEHSTTGRGQTSSLSQQHAPPPETSGR